MARKNRKAANTTPGGKSDAPRPFTGKHPHLENLKKRTPRYTHKTTIEHRPTSEPLYFSKKWGLLLLVYYLAATFFPPAGALDPNATRFLALSLVNLAAFAWLFYQPGIRHDTRLFSRFFTTPVAMAWSAFLVFSLLSFTKAIEPGESMLQFAKVFSVFSAGFVVSVALMRDMRLVRTLAFFLTVMLLIESILVFINIRRFIEGSISFIYETTSLYSNKNILASAIFVKIPFALYFVHFDRGWKRRLGWIGLTLGFLATFFLATRAFYLGLFVLSGIFMVYLGIRWIRERQRTLIQLGGKYLAALLVAFLVFTFTQRNLYPWQSDRQTQGVAEQISTISSTDTSVRRRLDAWGWSLDMIRENPLLGVGSGNWKVVAPAYDNKTNPDYFYIYKAHNDFLEHAAETGLFGGLAYLAIFVLLGWGFLRALLRKNGTDGSAFPWLFLSAAGTAFFAVDAFANFPTDRPEIQVLFVFLAATGIAAWPRQTPMGSETGSAGKVAGGEIKSDGSEHKEDGRMTPIDKVPPGNTIIFVGWILLLITTTWFTGQNFRSVRLQRLFIEDVADGRLNLMPDMFAGEFPPIPRITLWGGPINTIEARYLLAHDENERVIELLRAESSSPWDGRRELFLGRAFSQAGQPDSALVYAREAYAMKPYYYETIQLIGEIMEEQGRPEDVIPYLETYLEQERGNEQAWLALASLYEATGAHEKALAVVEEARALFPGSFQLEGEPAPEEVRQREESEEGSTRGEERQVEIPQADASQTDTRQTDATPETLNARLSRLFRTGLSHYENDNYEETIRYLSEFIELAPFDSDAYGMRAYAYFRLGEYQRCINDVNALDAQGEVNPSLINFRGVSHQRTGNLERACEDYARAMAAGLENGRLNYERFCLGEQQ